MNKEYATGLVAVIKERFLFSHTHFETEAQTVDDTARLHNQQHTNSNSGSESVSSNSWHSQSSMPFTSSPSFSSCPSHRTGCTMGVGLSKPCLHRLSRRQHWAGRRQRDRKNVPGMLTCTKFSDRIRIDDANWFRVMPALLFKQRLGCRHVVSQLALRN